MRVVILSAGRGTRMLPLTRNTPKALLDLGHGITVIESQLNSIRDAGVKQVSLVLGFLAEQVEAKVRHFPGLECEFIYNPFFDVSNNLISLWFARHRMDEDFISLNGDDIFHPDVMRTLVAAPRTADIVMVIDKKAKYEAEDMKVSVDGERVLAVSKQIPVERANGESIGMIRYTGRGALAMRDVLDRMVRQPSGKEVFYLAAVQALVDQGTPVAAVEVPQSQWSEIDFHPDLELIRTNVLRMGTDSLINSPPDPRTH